MNPIIECLRLLLPSLCRGGWALAYNFPSFPCGTALPMNWIASLRASRGARELVWVLLAALGVYFALIFIGYSPSDPGWSRDAAVESIANPGGRVGAWLADLFLSLFGISAWWMLAFAVRGLWSAWRLWHGLEGPERGWRASFAVAAAGLLLLLLSSSALEALRFHAHTFSLPQGSGPGGVIGVTLAETVAREFGFTGGTLLLLALWMAAVSLTFGMSWLDVCERIGAGVETAVGALQRHWERQRAAAPGGGGRFVFSRGETAGLGLSWRRRWERFLSGVGALRARWQARRTAPGRSAVPPRVEPSLGTEESPAVAPRPSVRAEDAQAAASRPETSDEAVHRPPSPKQPIEHGRSRAGAAHVPANEGTLEPLPPLALLDAPAPATVSVSAETMAATARLIESKLAEFGVRVQVVGTIPGPVVTRYEIEPATGVKGAQIVNLAKDLARALSLVSIRVVEIVPGKSCMALEVPNPKRQIVRLSEVLDSRAYREMASPLTLCLGKDIAGQPVVADLAKMPHLLVAGTTGSGKSVGINAMILSLIYKSTPERVRLIMVDPKMLELSIYEGIPHLLAPVVTDMRLAAQALDWCVGEMERRYKLMAALGVRNIAGYNALLERAQREGEYLGNPFSLTPDSPEPLEKMPYIVVVVDELADLMMVVGKRIEELIARLAQKARAAGIHLILATQRPSVDVITGLIKANVPTRIAFQVSSKIDSRTILDQMGAETLLGMGDMLYLAPGTGMPQRVHGAFVADDEVHRVVEYLKRLGPPRYVEEVLAEPEEEEEGLESPDGGEENDPLYDQAVEVVLRTRRPSISLVQRHLRIGYNRAARLIEAMERAGLVSPPEHNGNRQVLVPARGEEV